MPPSTERGAQFDADTWVRLAKEAGMKYIGITSKHHDGFAMFKSAASPYNIYDATPFKRDPLKELAAACQQHGVKLQPGIITNNRLGGGYLGDTETPENKVPATGYPRDWEACMTMNDTWGFKSYDHNWKSGEKLIRTLVDIASKGGNYLLNAPGKALALTPSSTGLRVKVPATAPDAISSVVVLEGVGTIEPLPPPPISPEADGTLALGCDDADLVGQNLRVEGNTQLNLTGWNNAAAYPQWDVRIEKPGTYKITALYAVAAGQEGSEFTVAVGAARVSATTASTNGTFKTLTLGTVRVEKTGPVRITVKPVKIAGPELMRLRALTLKPTAAP